MKRGLLFSFLCGLFLIPIRTTAEPGGWQEVEASGAPQKRTMNVADVLAIKQVGDVRMHPGGRWAAYVVTERDFDENVNNSDVWIVSTNSGDPVRLTYNMGKDDSPRWSPDGSWLAFRSDRSGRSAVHGIFPGGGESWKVTDWKTPIAAFEVSPDGRSIAFTAREEKSPEQKDREKESGRPTVWNEYYADQWSRLWAAPLQDHRAGEARRVSGDGHQVSAFVWGPDSKRLAFAARPSPALRTFVDGAVYAGDKSGESRQLLTDMPGGESPLSWTDAGGLIFSATGRTLGTYNRRLWRLPSEGGAPVSLTSKLDENAIFVSVNDTAMLVETLHRTSRRLNRIPFLEDGTGGVPEPLTDGGRYRGGFSSSRDSSRVAYLAETWDSPPDIWVRDLPGGVERKLTDIHPQVRRLDLGRQRVVTWASRADEEKIEGVLTLPAGHSAREPVPLLLVIHGGPSGVSSDRFLARRGAYAIQVLAGRGFAVLQPNYRGSTGYGERFRGLNRGDISGKDWIDIDSGVDAMIERGIADPERLGIMGWSFGGHHTFWGLTQTDRFKAASAGAGANDLISMYSQTDIPEFYHTYLGPKPWENFRLYQERSAYRFVDRVTTPLLIQVGEKDERVPAEQSIQFYVALRTIGKAEAELVVYPGQPHGVRDPRLMRDLLRRNVEWFTKRILAAPASSGDE